MTTPPTQRGGVRLPRDLAEVLRVLAELNDPRLPATLATAHEGGWTYRLLAHALGMAPAGARKIAGRAPGAGHGPIPGIPSAPEDPQPDHPVSRFATVIEEAREEARMRAWARLAQTVTAGEEEQAREEATRAPAAEERAQARAAREAERAQARIQSGAETRKLLRERNLRALEDWPGPDVPMWVQCRWCKRCWQRNSADPQKCPHTGEGDPNPPLPAPKTAAAPPSFEGWRLRAGRDHLPDPSPAPRFTAWLGRRDEGGRYTLFVQRWAGFPQADDERLSMVTLDGAGPEDAPPFDAAADALAAADWHLAEGAHWTPRRPAPWEQVPGPGHQIQVTTDLITLHEIGLTVMHSTARAPDKAAEQALKRRAVPCDYQYQDPDTGRMWPVYPRGLIRALLTPVS